MKLTFTKDKMTKNTVRFTEVVDDDLSMPMVGTMYVSKAALHELGYKDGDKLTVELNVG